MDDAEKRILRRLRAETVDVADRAPAASVVQPSPRWRTGALLAGAVVIIVLVVFMRIPASRKATPTGIDLHAIVESADGGLFRVAGGQALPAGNRIEAGDAVRTDGGIGTVLALPDG